MIQLCINEQHETVLIVATYLIGLKSFTLANERLGNSYTIKLKVSKVT